MTDKPGTVSIGYLPQGNEMYGAGKVLIVVGNMATYIDPSTARMAAVQLILNAEKAGLPPMPPELAAPKEEPVAKPAKTRAKK